ncbi:7tm 6 domain containing protein, partial [Asbolus verrucosus]
MERLDWKKTLNLTILILRMLGLWPSGDGSYEHNFYRFYAIAAMLIQVSHILFQTIHLFLIFDDLEALTATIFIWIAEILALLKIYCLIANMKILKQLLVTVNQDLFQPKSPHQEDLLQPNFRVWTRIIMTIRWFSVIWLSSWCSFPILDKTYREYRLPCLAWYPYDTKTSPYYELTYLYQVVVLFYLCMAYIDIGVLIGALNMYIGAQFDILCDDIRNLHHINGNTFKDVNTKLKECIHHHREILKFADYANQFYNWLIFFQFVIGGITIGFSMFQLTLVIPFSSEFFSFLMYSNGISVEVFMYCWFGNEIQIKSSQLSYAVFESNWTSFSPEVKKNLTIFILRNHTSLKISALGLITVSLETFVKIIGLWPSDDGLYGRNLYTFYSVITILLFHVGHVLSQTVNLYFIKDDLQAVTGTVFILLMEMLAMLKAYSLTKNMRMLKKLIATLNKRLFQPKNSQQIKLIQSNINAWKAISSTFWFLAVGWLFFYSCFPILDKTFQEYRLPFLAWYPYNTNTSPQYEVTYLYQVVAISYLCMINVNIDGLIAALNMFIGSQFDILSHDLKNLHDITQGISKNVNKKLLNCIKHHKEILKFANNANRFYNWLIFVEFFVGGVSIGLSMFQLT